MVVQCFLTYVLKVWLGYACCLNCPILMLPGFPEWPEVMTAWGNKMLEAVHTVAEMAAVGFDLPSSAFTERMAFGPHLLAPTGAQLTLRHLCRK